MRLKWINGLFICLCIVLLMSHNTFAESGSKNYTSAQGAYGYFIPPSTYGRNVSFSGSLPIELITGSTTTDKSLYGVVINYTNIPSVITDTDQYHTINWQYTLSASNQNIIWETNESRVPITLSENMGGTTTNFTDKCNYVLSGDNLGVVCSRSYSQGQRPSSVAITLGRTGVFTYGTDLALGLSHYNSISPFVGATIKVSAVSMTWTSSGNDQSGVIDSINNVNNTVNNFYNAESGAANNISNQEPPASGSGQNSTTSSLLDTLGSFLTAITNLSATNCNVVLAFPQFAGGSQTVNICQNKEYTGNIVSIAGSIILVLFYLPVAFMLINKIYSEIRSFTNG